MGADSQLVLPGNFVAGQNYLVRGATMIAWRAALLRDRALPGPGMRETQTDAGRILSALVQAGAGGGEASPAFFRLFQAGGKWMLQGGQVTGGLGNEVVADIDLGTVGSEPSDGTLFWLACTGDGTVTDGRLYSGWDLDSATAASGSVMPANTLPTPASTTGKAFHLLLGSWSSGVFSPSAGGNLSIGICLPGGYVPTRF